MKPRGSMKYVKKRQNDKSLIISATSGTIILQWSRYRVISYNCFVTYSPIQMSNATQS